MLYRDNYYKLMEAMQQSVKAPNENGPFRTIKRMPRLEHAKHTHMGQSVNKKQQNLKKSNALNKKTHNDGASHRYMFARSITIYVYTLYVYTNIGG